MKKIAMGLLLTLSTASFASTLQESMYDAEVTPSDVKKALISDLESKSFNCGAPREYETNKWSFSRLVKRELIKELQKDETKLSIDMIKAEIKAELKKYGIETYMTFKLASDHRSVESLNRVSGRRIQREINQGTITEPKLEMISELIDKRTVNCTLE